MVATATILDDKNQLGNQSTSVTRYFGNDIDLVEGNAVGITIGATTHLHTVPAGGQTLYEALRDLAGDINVHVDGDGAAASGNNQFDCCLHVRGSAGSIETLTLPVFTVA